MEYVGYVYKIYCNVTSKVYIGITTQDINRRWDQHKNQALLDKDNNHFHKAILKYGWEQFEKIILVTLKAASKEVLIDSLKILEETYIKKFDSYYSGYNSTLGGDGVYGDVCCRKVLIYNELGEHIDTLESRAAAALKYNVPTTSISSCCNRVIYSAGWKDGLRLVFRNEDDLVTSEDISKLQKVRKNIKLKVKSYNYYTGDPVDSYNSITEASQITGINEDSISKCVKRQVISTKFEDTRLVWRQIDDAYIPQYTIEGFVDGKSIGKYVDTTIIKKIYGIRPTSISNCLSGKSSTAGKINGQKIQWKRI